MKKETFFGLRSSHLSNNNANALFQSTLQVVIPVRSSLGDMGNAILDWISSAPVLKNLASKLTLSTRVSLPVR